MNSLCVPPVSMSSEQTLQPMLLTPACLSRQMLHVSLHCPSLTRGKNPPQEFFPRPSSSTFFCKQFVLSQCILPLVIVWNVSAFVPVCASVLHCPIVSASRSHPLPYGFRPQAVLFLEWACHFGTVSNRALHTTVHSSPELVSSLLASPSGCLPEYVLSVASIPCAT